MRMAKHDILLIGDGTNLLKTIGWVLDYKGFAVKVTATPEAALEALVKKNYDLVIAKLTTADRENLDILKRAKRLNSEVKTMVVSDKKDGIFPLEAYQIEVDDYLMMPVSPPELWRRVNRCLEDQEVMDLQPVPGSAARAGKDVPANPQLMLIFHDIRGSMVATAASLKLMARGTVGGMSPTVKEKLHEVTGRVEHTIKLMEDFIGESLADRFPGAGDEACLDLSADIVEPVLAELAAEIRDHQITLVNRLHDHGDGKLVVRGSKVWLQSVFRNLISNGVKYGGRNCTIVVDCRIEGSASRLTVYNTGKAVPKDSRSLLFPPVLSMRPSKDRRQGLGFGLSLSRDIMQNFGGDLWYEAQRHGSTFVVSLPPC
jgi:two-component system, sensor histidine kinase and response regulator